MHQKYPLVALITVAIPAIVLSLILWDRKSETQFDQKASLSEITASDQVKGNQESKIELIEYSDFQCPACGAYYPYLKQITKEFSEQIRFVYRHFPLKQHKNAELAGRAAEAAGKQNKFWEMHDLLFENQNSWATSSKAENIFISLAQQLDLDIEKFQQDLGSEEIKNKVGNDLKNGLKVGVNATPTFFLNGKMLDPMSPQKLKEGIDATTKNQ